MCRHWAGWCWWGKNNLRYVFLGKVWSGPVPQGYTSHPRPMQTDICSLSLWPIHFVLGLVTEVSVVLTSCCQWRKHMAFSGPHGGCVGFNPHESLCWIQSSHLRQLILKSWNSSNCKNGSEVSQIWCVDVSSGVNIAQGLWEDFSEVYIAAKQDRVEESTYFEGVSFTVLAVLLVGKRSIFTPLESEQSPAISVFSDA